MSRRNATRTKRYWYFVTSIDFGDKMVLSPRVPYSMADGEPTIKRICVAPTAAHCISAVGVCGIVNVYRTSRRVYGTKCWNVGDSRLTDEHWIFRKCKFVRVANIHPDSYYKHTWYRGYDIGSDGYQKQRREKRSIVRNLMKIDPRLAIIKKSDTVWQMPQNLMQQNIERMYL